MKAPERYRDRLQHLALAVATLLLAVLGTACARAPHHEDTKATIALLTAQSDAWDKAIVRKDRPAIEGNMSEDFRQIDGAGNLETKKSFVDGLIDADLVIDPYTVEEFEVRLYGDTALLTGRTKMTGRYKDKVFTSHYRYTDTYVRSGGAWKVVSVQISKIPN